MICILSCLMKIMWIISSLWNLSGCNVAFGKLRILLSSWLFFLPTSEKVFLVWLYTLTLGQREINSWITNVHLYLLICWCYYFFFFIVIFFFLEGWKSVLIYLLELIVIGLHQMLRSKVFQLLVVLMEQVLARWERKFVLLNPWNYCNSELVFYSGFLT